MGLTSDQERQVLAHIQTKVAGGCPMCGNRNWSLEQDVSFLGILDPEYRQPVEGKIFPVITATCSNCFWVAHFSVKRMGVLG